MQEQEYDILEQEEPKPKPKLPGMDKAKPPLPGIGGEKKNLGMNVGEVGGTVGSSKAPLNATTYTPNTDQSNPFSIGGQYNQPKKLDADNLDLLNTKHDAAIAEQIKKYPLRKIPLTPILDNTALPKPITEIDINEALARNEQHKIDMQTAIDNTTLKVLKQKGIVAGKGSPYYEAERKKIEEKTKPTMIGGIVIKGADATYHKDKDGNIGLDRNLGFLEGIRKGFNAAVDGEDEANAFAEMNTQQKVEYANKQMEGKPTEYMEERGGVGELLGGATPYLVKAAAAGTLATAAAIAAPETGGASLVGLAPTLTVLLTAPDMIKQGAKDEIMTRYMQLKQERPNIPDEELMKIAEQGEISGGIVGAAEALAFTTTLKLPILKDSKNVLTTYLKGVASSAIHLGGIMAGTKAAQLAERKLEGYNVDTDKAVDEIATTFTENATAGAILNGLISGAHTLPKVVKSAFKFSLKDTPISEIKTALDANVEAGRIPPEVAEQTIADIDGYKTALAKTSDGLTPETQASVAGLIQARDNVAAEMATKDPTQRAVYEQKIEAYNKQIEKITKTNNPLKYEIDEVTGNPIDKVAPELPDVTVPIEGTDKKGVPVGEDVPEPTDPSTPQVKSEGVVDKASNVGGDVVYHGSPIIGEKGDLTPSGGGELGAGVYFTRNEGLAKNYSKPRGEVKNMAEAESKSGVANLDLSGLKIKTVTKEEYLNKRNEFYDKEQELNNGEWDADVAKRAEEKLIKQYEKEGYDGLEVLDEQQGVIFPDSVKKAKHLNKKAVEQSLKETPKAETTTTTSNVGVEEGSGGVGGDVGATTKALEEVAKKKPNASITFINKQGYEQKVNLNDTYEFTQPEEAGLKGETIKGFRNQNNTGIIPFSEVAEAYHKAKKDGSNPELVKAVEQSLKETPKAETPKVESKEGFTEGKDLNKMFTDLKSKYGDKKGSALYEVANRLVNPNKNTIVEIRGNGVVVKEGENYILKPFGNTDANSKKWTLYKGIDVTDQFAKSETPKAGSVGVGGDVEAMAKALEGADLSKMPNVSWHGSKNKNLIFGQPKEGKASKSNMQLDFGTHFTSEDYASFYEGDKGKKYPVIIDLKSPLDLTQGMWWKDDPNFEKVHQLIKDLKLEKSYGSIDFIDKNGDKQSDIQGVSINAHKLTDLPPKRVSDALKKNGFDGIIYEPYHPQGGKYYEAKPKSFIVLNNSSIKEPTPKNIAEAYHKAKSDGSNPELVKEVEDLIGEQSIKETTIAGSGGVVDVEATAKALESLNETDHKAVEDINDKLYQPKYVEENKAREVIESFTHYKSGSNKYPATKWARWFQSVDANAKKDIVDDIKNNPELRNSMLSLLYDLCKKEIGFKGSFDEFILEPIKLYRGVTDADKKGKGQEGFSAYSISKNRVSGYAHNRSSENPEVREVIVRPIDTYGAVNYIMGAEVEVLLPQSLSKETLQKEFNRLVELNIGEFSENQKSKLEQFYTNDDYIGGVQYAKSVINGTHKTIAEAYHKAKADGTNPELVKAVEQSLKETTKAETTTPKGNTSNVGGDVDFAKRKKEMQTEYDKLQKERFALAKERDEIIGGGEKYRTWGKKQTDEKINEIRGKQKEIDEKQTALQKELKVIEAKEKGSVELFDHYNSGTGSPNTIIYDIKNNKLLERENIVRGKTKDISIEDAARNKFASTLRGRNEREINEAYTDKVKAKYEAEINEEIAKYKPVEQSLKETTKAETKPIKNEEAQDQDTKQTEGVSEPKKVVSEPAQEGRGKKEPPSEPAEPVGEDKPKKDGITHAAVEELRKIIGEPEYEGKPVENHETLIEEAQKTIKDNPNAANEVLDKMDNGGKITNKDNAIAAIYKATIDAEMAKNPTPELLKRATRLAKALDVSGTELGKALESRKLVGTEDNLTNFLLDKQAAQGTALTETQIKSEAAKYEELKAAHDALEKQLEVEREQHAKDIAEMGVNKAKAKAKKAAKKSDAEYKAERKEIVDAARKALKDIRDNPQSSAAPLFRELVAIAPHVKKFMESVANNTADKFDNILTDIHAEFKDVLDGLTKRNVLDILAGEYDTAPKQQTRNEKKNTIRLLQREAELLKQLERERKGEEKAKTESQKTQSNRRIDELKEKIKEVRSQNKNKEVDTEAPEDMSAGEIDYNAKLQKKLTEKAQRLIQDIRDKKYLEEEPAKPVFKKSRKTQLLEDKVIDLENKIRHERSKDEYNKRGKLRKGFDKVMEVLGLRRLVQSALDMSVPFRQGATMLSPRKIDVWLKGFRANLQSVLSPKKFERIMSAIRNDPMYHEMVKDNVVFNDLGSADPNLHNEDFRKSFVYKIPLISEPLKASNRSADAFLNVARIEMYKKLRSNLEKRGLTRESDPKAFKFIGNWTMAMTGRGTMHSALEKPAMNAVLGNTFYGARLMASRFNLLNPVTYFDPRIPKEAKREAMKDMAAFTLTMVSVATALSYTTGAKVSLNPDDGDFLQLRYGDKVYDISGGLANYVRTGLRILKAGYTKFTGTKYQGKEATKKAGESSLNFIRNKFSPNTAYAVDAFFGKNYGQEFDASEIAQIYPMYTEDFLQAIKEEGGLTATATVLLPNILGIGYGSYASKGQIDTNLEDLLQRNMRSDEMNSEKIHNYKDKGRAITFKEFNDFADKRDEKIKKDLETLFKKGINGKPYKDLTQEEVVDETNFIKANATRETKKELFGENKKSHKEKVEDKNLLKERKQNYKGD